MDKKPLMIDLYCGLGGWASGGISEGYYVVGFDIERHDYGTGGYPAQLVLQDALTLHGKQFKDAALIVASPPCQEYSYMAMPWSRAKAIEAEYKSGVRDTKKLTALFDACFRIQREAIEAAGHFIPLVVENVRGAQKWVGRSRWNYGSYHLWGDVPALMPMTHRVQKFNPDGTAHPPGSWFAVADSKNRGSGSWFNVAHNTVSGCGNNPVAGKKVPGFRFDGSGKSFQTASVAEKIYPGTNGLAFVEYRGPADGRVKHHGDWFDKDGMSPMRKAAHGSKARKAASAAIAKIPFALARHIAAYWKPRLFA